MKKNIYKKHIDMMKKHDTVEYKHVQKKYINEYSSHFNLTFLMKGASNLNANKNSHVISFL